MKSHWSLLVVLFLFSCQSDPSYSLSSADERYQVVANSSLSDDLGPDDFYEETLEEEESQSTEGGQTIEPNTNSPSTQGIRKRVIKTGELVMKVDDVNTSSRAIQKIIAKQGGYISSQNLTSNSYQIRNYLTVRIPIYQFDSLLNALAGQGRFIEQRKITAKDVTKEFVDIEIRLKTKKMVRDRYVQVLRNKAKNVEEILKAEEAIRVIQEEIEVQEGRLRYLKDQTSLSTIHLELYQTVEYRPSPVSYRKSFKDELIGAFGNGWDMIKLIFLGIITIWPLLIIFSLLIWQRKRIFRFRNKK